MRRPAPLLGASALAMATATLFMGCAMKRPAAEASTADASAAEAPAEEAGGDEAMSGGAVETKSTDASSADSAPADEPEDESKPTTAPRELSTVARALDAFEEDEVRLVELLSGQATALDANTCGSVCDALASMRRASDAICDLAGEDDRRCTEARDKIAGNEKRVEGRGCRCGP